MRCSKCQVVGGIESKLIGGWCAKICTNCLNQWHVDLNANPAYHALQRIEREIRAVEIAAQCNDSVAADVYVNHLKLAEEKQRLLDLLFDFGRKFQEKRC